MTEKSENETHQFIYMQFQTKVSIFGSALSSELSLSNKFLFLYFMWK